MAECKDGSATLHDVDRATFTRFVEFLLTGDYTPEQPARKNDTRTEPCSGDAEGVDQSQGVRSESPEADQVTADLGGMRIGHPWAKIRRDAAYGQGFVRARAVQKKTNRKLNDGLPPTLWCGHGQFLEYCTTCNPAHGSLSIKETKDPHNETILTHSTEPADANRRPVTAYGPIATGPPLPTNSAYIFNPDFTLDQFPLCMSHAKLYVFADYYAITALQNLTAHQLKGALSQEHLGVFSNSKVVALVKYVYQNTPDRKKDKLRRVVVDFAIDKGASLRNSKEFFELLAEGGPLPGDLFDVMAR